MGPKKDSYILLLFNEAPDGGGLNLPSPTFFTKSPISQVFSLGYPIFSTQISHQPNSPVLPLFSPNLPNLKKINPNLLSPKYPIGGLFNVQTNIIWYIISFHMKPVYIYHHKNSLKKILVFITHVNNHQKKQSIYKHQNMVNHRCNTCSFLCIAPCSDKIQVYVNLHRHEVELSKMVARHLLSFPSQIKQDSIL